MSKIITRTWTRPGNRCPCGRHYSYTVNPYGTRWQVRLTEDGRFYCNAIKLNMEVPNDWQDKEAAAFQAFAKHTKGYVQEKVL